MADLDARHLLDQVEQLAARVDEIEARVFEQQQHVAVTVPFGQSLSMQHSHPEADALEYGVWVVPINLRAPLQLKRVWTIVASDDGTAAEFGLAVYRLDAGVVSRGSAAKTLALQKVREIGFTSVTSPVDARWTITLGQREETLDPAIGTYFLGFQGNKHALWNCPGGNTAALPVRAFRTSSTNNSSSTIGTFPARLSVPGGAAATNVTPPAVVLYSAEGIRLHEDRSL